MKSGILALKVVLAAVAAFTANKSSARPTIDTFLSAPPVCVCFSLNVGMVVDDIHTVGINSYVGGGFSTNLQRGIFVRSHPWGDSFFTTVRLGRWSEKIGRWENAAGIDVGNRWFYESGFTQGVTWIGMDFSLQRSSFDGIPHGLRYEIGWRF